MRLFKIILSLLILLTTGNLFGQYGFKAGVNIPNISIDTKNSSVTRESENQIGFNVGVFLDLAKIEGIQLTSNLIYSKKRISGNFGYASAVINQKSDFSADYLIYSVSGKYNFVDSKEDINPYVFLAPRVNLYLSNNFDASNYTEEPYPEDVEEFVSRHMTDFGFGLSVGAGLDFKTSSSFTPFVELQISPDFYNVYDDGFFYSVRSNAIEAMVGIRIK